MKTILAAALLAAAVPSFADDFSLLGVWSGRMEITAPPLPAGTSSAVRARLAALAAEARNGRLTLRMFRDHRYTLRNENMPSFGPASMRGIWSKRGDVLSLIPTGTSRYNRFLVGPNGRRMVGDAQNRPNHVRFVFVR